MLEIGQNAPGFTLPNQDGEIISLADFEGEMAVIYFYPRAESPGCTKEACGFRDRWDAFQNNGINVLGISTDSVPDLKEFSDKYRIPFDLLSDEGGDVSRTYESYGKLEFGENSFMGSKRNTYLLDEQGNILNVYEGVSPDMHAQEIVDDIITTN